MEISGVKKAYNALASRYLADRDMLKSGPYVRKLLKHLRPQSAILDLGCGAGEPVDDILLSAGHSVHGIDISEEMIRRARRLCPGGEYTVSDIAQLAPGQYSVDAIVSFYAFFHVPRARHAELLKTLASYLPAGGMLLITLGDREFEGETEFYGTRIWWSQWGATKNSELVRRAGFEIILDELSRSGGETHQVILARKN